MDKIILTVFILSIILTIFILAQAPVQESLATAFNGEKIYKNKIDTILIKGTWLVAIIIGLLLVLF